MLKRTATARPTLNLRYIDTRIAELPARASYTVEPCDRHRFGICPDSNLTVRSDEGAQERNLEAGELIYVAAGRGLTRARCSSPTSKRSPS